MASGRRDLECIRGRAWVFGDHINTDLIVPGFALFMSQEEQSKAVFANHRPTWASQVEPGDVIIAGKNFGTGSGRQIGSALAGLGIAAVVAESFNGLGLRSCINGGLAAQPCKGVSEAFTEGDLVELDWPRALVRNLSTETELVGTPLPAELREIVAAGGILEMLREEGLLEARYSV